jgi:small subunit ribosomal protein S14
MARLGLILSNERKKKLVEKYKDRRKQLKSQILATDDIHEKVKLVRALDKLPKNSSAVRVVSRCSVNGRSKGVVGKIAGVCRMVFRDLVSNGCLPGFVKGK